MIGVSCLALPVGCPAIVAFSHVQSVWSTATNIWHKVSENRRTAGVALLSVGAALAAEAAGRTVGPVTRIVSNGIVEATMAHGLGSEVVRTLTSRTLSGVIHEGATGLASWGMVNSL